MSAGGGKDAERHIQLSHGDAEQLRSALESRVYKENNGGNLVVWSGFDRNPLILAIVLRRVCSFCYTPEPS